MSFLYVGCLLATALSVFSVVEAETANWGQWTDWTSCLASCGKGIRVRSRTCLKGSFPTFNPLLCGLKGSGRGTESCTSAVPCPNSDNRNWGPWSDCSTSCGPGTRSRTDKDLKESKDCTKGPCPTTANWLPWGGWYRCSVTCGRGYTIRRRRCVAKSSGKEVFSRSCEGRWYERKRCDNIPTSCTAGWLEWTPWSNCNQTCGEAFKLRFRKCSGKNCTGPSREEEACSSLPRCAFWTDWRPWGACVGTCGIGVKSRERKCRSLKGEKCPGESSQRYRCRNPPCPNWEAWDPWSSCSTTCGVGRTVRTRYCLAGRCVGDWKNEMQCNQNVTCGVGHWGAWGKWTPTDTCGSSTQSRTRICQTNGQVTCPGQTKQTMAVQLAVCPFWTEWGEWSQPSSSCGNGTRVQSRTCKNSFSAAACPGSATQSQSFSVKNCGDNITSTAAWMEWGPWNGCSATCGAGTTNRNRKCSGVGCTGESSETKSCDSVSCPGPGWTEWGPWTKPTATCGKETVQRKRSCKSGVECPGNSTEVKEAVLKPCAHWSEWGPWSKSQVTCGSYKTYRVRFCEHGVDKVDCLGDARETAERESVAACPGTWTAWGKWSESDHSCGKASKSRKRQCSLGSGCAGNATETVQINAGPCPSFWSGWNPWTACSSTCGTGYTDRTRLCHGPQCPGSYWERQICSVMPCATWGPWGQWGTCSETCGFGYRRRTRPCQGKNTWDCTGYFMQRQVCTFGICVRAATGQILDWDDVSGGRPNITTRKFQEVSGIHYYNQTTPLPED